jgi:hypothetical protein
MVMRGPSGFIFKNHDTSRNLGRIKRNQLALIKVSGANGVSAFSPYHLALWLWGQAARDFHSGGVVCV